MFLLKRCNSFAHGHGAGNGRGIWNIEFYSRSPDHISVPLGFAAGGCIYDQLYFFVLYGIDHMGATDGDFIDQFVRYALVL